MTDPLVFTKEKLIAYRYRENRRWSVTVKLINVNFQENTNIRQWPSVRSVHSEHLPNIHPQSLHQKLTHAINHTQTSRAFFSAQFREMTLKKSRDDCVMSLSGGTNKAGQWRLWGSNYMRADHWTKEQIAIKLDLCWSTAYYQTQRWFLGTKKAASHHEDWHLFHTFSVWGINSQIQSREGRDTNVACVSLLSINHNLISPFFVTLYTFIYRQRIFHSILEQVTAVYSR